MAVDLSPEPFALIVGRLRAAGCVYAEDEARILVEAAENEAELTTMVERRATGLPLEYVVGWAEFCGLRIAMDPGVFVPRRRTEFLVHHAVGLLGGGERLVVVDLCCGSGAIGVAVASSAAGPVELHAADIDPTAVRCAEQNVEPLGGYVHHGDLYGALPTELRGRIDLIVANTPYVPSDEVSLLPPEARLYEPRQALDGGVDGLDLARRIAAKARQWLAPGGRLLIETSLDQAPVLSAEYVWHHLRPAVVHDDDLDATVVVGTMPG